MSLNEDIPLRSGERPATTTQGPHIQLDQRSSDEIYDKLIERAFSIDGVTKGSSSVSLADTLAGLLVELPEIHGSWSLAVRSYVEPFHIHGASDTSIHIVLPEDLATAVINSGWGEAHPYADFPTQIMLYAPRDFIELEFVLTLIDRSVHLAMTSTSAS
jgi:hypothetical protein